MRARFLFRSVIVTATLAFFGGCAPIKPSGTVEPQPAMQAPGQPVAAPAPSPASDTQSVDQPTDDWIGIEIRRLVNTDPTTGAGIIVEVDGGNVTLRGTAVTRAGAWRAEAAARSVKGVKSVVNQIIVNAPSVTQ
ncbi:MAG: BON domain-containing protein [Verrucomicrobiia bacterium]|jgi:hypothetical protein